MAEEEYEVIPDPEFIADVGEEPEILPYPLAIERLAPGKRWYMEGDTLDGLVWEDNINDRPSNEAITTLAREMKAARPMARLRQLRDMRMREVDWVTLRSVRTGEAIPEEWSEYLQALADITETSPNPKLSNGELINVEWPERPDGKPAGLSPVEFYRL